MKLESFRRSQPEINLAPLVDVLFILLIFVLLAARFERTQVLEVSLPRAGGEPAAASASPVVVEVPVSGPLRLDGAAVAEDQLAARLRALAADRDVLVIAADRAISLERAAAILDIAAAAGFDSVSIITQGITQGPARAPAELR